MQCHYNYKRRSIRKIPQGIPNKREAITTLNVAQFSHWSIVILQRNPWAHWYICPSCDEVKMSFCATNWGVRKQLFTNSFLTTVESVTSQVFLSETQTNNSLMGQSHDFGADSPTVFQWNNCQQFVSDVCCIRLQYHGRGSYLATDHIIWAGEAKLGRSLASTIIRKYKWLSGPGSVVGIATTYGLDGPWIESRWGQDFPHLSRPAMRPTQPPVQRVLGLSRG
jgi:hypothetical protein